MSSEVKVGYRAVDGLQIRYADSDGPASQHLVLTSPWPESLHAFDPIWPRLSGTAGCWPSTCPASAAPNGAPICSPRWR
jgi:hypothetical protein